MIEIVKKYYPNFTHDTLFCIECKEKVRNKCRLEMLKELSNNDNASVDNPLEVWKRTRLGRNSTWAPIVKNPRVLKYKKNKGG